MRQTMHPVTLSRIFEVCMLSKERAVITSEDLSSYLSTTERRSEEILREMVTIGLIEEDKNKYFFTDRASTFYDAVLSDDLIKLHGLLMYSPFYSHFYSLIKNENKSLTQEQILTNINQLKNDIHYNNLSISVLCDWGERICSIQRNVFTNRYYAITSNLEEDCCKNIITTYHEISNDKKLGFKKIYVEIPLLREFVCESSHITRNMFDYKLIALYKKNIGKLEISGAPTITKAKRTSLQVKHMCVANMPGRLTLSLTSDEYLKGIEIAGRSYYYFAYHGGNLS